MNICILTSNLNIGGPTSLIYNFCKTAFLKNNSDNITVISLINDFQENIINDLRLFGVKVTILNKKRGFFDFPFLKKLKYELSKNKPDVIFCHLSGYFYSVLCGYNYKVKRLHVIHSLPKKDQNFLQRLFIKHGLNHNLILVSCCNYIKDLSIKLYKRDVVNVYNGIEVKNNNFERDNDVFVFGVASRLVKMKRIDFIVEAFKRMIESFPQKSFKLFIAGSGEQKSSLIDLCSKLSIDKAVEFISPSDFTLDFYKKIHCLCISSEWEAFPMSILESFSYACPVITFDIGGVGEVVSDGFNGFLSNDYSIDGIFDMMSKIAFSSNYNTLSSNAYKTSMEFSIEKNYQLFLEIFSEVNK